MLKTPRFDRIVYSEESIVRRKTCETDVGGVIIGGDNLIRVQSMTNTDTANVASTVKQIKSLAQAGSEIVRVTVNNKAAAEALPAIVDGLAQHGVEVPIVGDFHYNGHKLLQDHPECARSLSKIRINPGNVGKGKKRDQQFAKIIELACKYELPVRIGVNWGSLDQAMLQRKFNEFLSRDSTPDNRSLVQETLIESALSSAEFAESVGLPKSRIVLSCKLSEVNALVSIYTKLAGLCSYPLHLGLTEAGMGRSAIVSSTAALAILLRQGIGDTIRVSLTTAIGHKRSEEVLVAKDILQSLGLRRFRPHLVSCPGCGRTSDDYYKVLADEVNSYVDARIAEWSKNHRGVEQMKISVMGCVVNGPGEGKMADVGISLPGSGERPAALVYVDGKKCITLTGNYIARDFKNIIENYVKTRYPIKNIIKEEADLTEV